MKINKISSLLILTSALLYVSGCDKENDPKLCLEEPCGTVVADSMNITLFIEDNVDITSAGLVIDDVEVPLSLEGWDYSESNFFTCWKTIPNITSNSSVILGYEINGEVVFGALNVTRISSNQVVIEIDGENAEIIDYEVCDDTPSS